MNISIYIIAPGIGAFFKFTDDNLYNNITMPQEAVQERFRINSRSILNRTTSISLAVVDRLTYSNLRYIYITFAKASQIVFSTVLQKRLKTKVVN